MYISCLDKNPLIISNQNTQNHQKPQIFLAKFLFLAFLYFKKFLMDSLIMDVSTLRGEFNE